MQDNRPEVEEEILDQRGMPMEFNKRIEYNQEKIRDLHDKIR